MKLFHLKLYRGWGAILSNDTIEVPTSILRVRVWPRWTMRVASLVAAVMLFDQAVLAGQFLSGVYPMLLLHRENATYAGISVIVALAAAVLVRWPGRGPWWPMVAYLALFGLIALQIVMGFSAALAVHIPLGVLIILGAIALTAWAWWAR